MTDLIAREAILSGWYQESTGELFKGFPIGPEDTVVDVGCGNARNLLFCVERGARGIAIDLDERVVEEMSQTLCRAAPDNARALHGDAQKIPIDSECATRVICTEVLEHVQDPVAALGELVRIGKPGALYLLSVPGELQENLQKLVAPPAYFETPNHIRIFDQEQFLGMLAVAGLEVVEVNQRGFFWSIWMALWWATDTPIHAADHPAIHHWTKAWEAVLDTPYGWHFKAQLDKFMPKSIVIVARKPR